MNQEPVHNLKKGFTLIELIVVTAIILIITAVVLANYKNYTNDSALATAAYDMALTLRQTQLYGIAVKQSSTNQFETGYGLHFSSQPSSYIIYQDISQPLIYTYDSTNSAELVSTNQLQQGFTIQKICKVVSATETCVNADGTNPGFIDVEFIRPNPDAVITTNISGAGQTGATQSFIPDESFTTSYGARIYLTSGTKTRTVYIDKTGQISVN